MDRDKRLEAENRLSGKGKFDVENLEKLSDEEVRSVAYELQVHKVELEMQNEELQAIWKELDLSRAKYFDLYDMAPSCYIVISEKGIILEANLTATALVGLSRSAFIRHRFTQFIFKMDEDLFYLLMKKALASNVTENAELRIRKSDGTICWVNIELLATTYDGVQTIRIVLMDITPQKKVELELSISEDRYKSLVMSMEQGLALYKIIKDSNGKPIDYVYIDINQSYTRLIGTTRDMCIGRKLTELIDENDQVWIKSFDQVVLTGKPAYHENYVKSIGKYLAAYAYQPKEDQLAVLVSDIDARVRREQEITDLSYRDHLTGLYNRRFYEEEQKRLNTERNLPMTLAIGDVNGLKIMNDSFGHPFGDEVLKKTADAIRSGCREDDIVARVGGDEFVIILPNTNYEEAQKIIARVQALNKKKKVKGINISISFGLATKTSEKQKIADIFKEAEDHMYRLKLSESIGIKNKMIDLIMNALFEGNNKERLHSERVAKICEQISREMKFSQRDIKLIKLAGRVHDIGKIAVSEKILKSPDKHGLEEMNEIRMHSEMGFRILTTVSHYAEIGEFVLCHHERWDGSGYPKGLTEEAIPLVSRIISVADAYDAMTSERSYREVLSPKEAIEEISRCAGTQFDPHIARLFIDKVWQEAL